jgi:hypothetical protein
VTARATLGVLAVTLVGAATVAAQPPAGSPPSIKNAQLEARSAAGGLEAALRGVGEGPTPAWAAWPVPMDQAHSMCCWSSLDTVGRTRGQGCRLEGGTGSFSIGSGPGAPEMESDRTAMVMVRRRGGEITRIRTLSRSCAVDAGNLRLVWLQDVRPADSVRFLNGVVRGPRGGEDLLDQALVALASHAEPSALDVLVDAARRDQRRHVRTQALFWLSQRAGRRAREAIDQALEQDPESEVREHAVFALSQLPRDESVPRLIDLARSHRDPHVREKAMFWLGQSGDDRALAFFEQVLTR